MAEYARRSVVDRMRGAALLDVATYEEVEHDNGATGQAAVVVVIVAVCAAIGAVWRGGPSIIMAPIGAILSWLLIASYGDITVDPSTRFARSG